MNAARTFRTLLCSAGFALILAGCSGGGSSNTSAVPQGSGGITQWKNPFGSSKPGTLSVTFLPTELQNASHRRSPKYISAQGGSFVMVVTPLDPAEKNDFPNGAIGCVNASAPITAPVTLSVAAPPGPDYFTIAEYSGGCSGTTPPGATGALLTAFVYFGDQVHPANNFPAVVPGTGLTYNTPILVQPGVANDLNLLTWIAYNNLPQAPAPPPVAPAYPFTGPNAALYSASFGQAPGGAPPTGTTYPAFLMGGVLAQVKVGATIPNPVMETGVFQKLIPPTNQVVIPLNVQTLDSAGGSLSSPVGVPVPAGAVVPIPLNTNVTLTLTEMDPSSVPAGNLPAPHTKLWLVDTTANKVVASSTTSIQFSQNGALDQNTITLGTTNGGACGGLCAVGDAMAFYLTYDGSTQIAYNFATVNPSFTPAPLASVAGVPAIVPVNLGTGTITGQASVVSTTNLVPVPTTAYTAPVGIAQVAASGLYVADTTAGGGQVKLDNSATASAAVAGAAFTGLAYDSFTLPNPTLWVVDNNASTAQNPNLTSGIFGYAAGTLANAPGALAPLKLSSNNPTTLNHPAGIACCDFSNALYVAAQNDIWNINLTTNSINPVAGDVVGSTSGDCPGAGVGCPSTTAVAPLSARFNFGTSTYIGMIFNPTNGVLFFADPGNGKIRGWDIGNQLPAPLTGTVFTAASVAGITGLGFAGTGFASGVLATTANGLFSLPGLGGGGTVTPQLILAAQGSACASSVDGFIGANGGPSNPYTLQYNAGWTGGTIPSGAIQAALGAPIADSMAAAQVATKFANTGTVCKPLGITYITGNAGAFPGGTYIFTEAGKLRGYL